MLHTVLDTPDRLSDAEGRAGRGIIELRRVGGRTVVTRCRAHSPLKLLNPSSGGSSAWVFSSTFGGGLVAGDEVALDVNVGQGCACLLGTQSATKVYRSPEDLAARQTLNVVVGDGASCVIAPHPVTCFAEARFVQRHRIQMHPSSSLVLIDWITSGRHATGERWAFDRYDSRTDILIDGRHVFRDALLLSGEDGPIDGRHRTGGFNCFGYAVVLGRAFINGANASLRRIERERIPATANCPLIFAASPLNDGVIFRAAGIGTEIVGRWLLEQLASVGDALGCDGWSRMLA